MNIHEDLSLVVFAGKVMIGTHLGGLNLLQGIYKFNI